MISSLLERQNGRSGWWDEGHLPSPQSVVTESGKIKKKSPQILTGADHDGEREKSRFKNRFVNSCCVLLFCAKLLPPFISFLSSRQLQVSGFTRSPETIECGTKRETATHFALLVASRCNTTTLTFGSRPQHQNINTNVSVWWRGNMKGGPTLTFRRRNRHRQINYRELSGGKKCASTADGDA